MPDIKETLIDLLTGYSLDTYEDVQYVADELIAKGVLPVVRCKDCKHWLKDVAGCTDNVGRCEWANYMVGAVGYCVYGERKEAEGDG